MDAALKSRLATALAARTDVGLCIAFGSRARGTERPDSDLDLACDVDTTTLLELTAALSSAVGLEVDVVMISAATIPLLESMVRDGETVYERTPGRAASFRAHALASLDLDRPWLKRMQDAFLRRLAGEVT